MLRPLTLAGFAPAQAVVRWSYWSQLSLTGSAAAIPATPLARNRRSTWLRFNRTTN